MTEKVLYTARPGRYVMQYRDSDGCWVDDESFDSYDVAEESAQRYSRLLVREQRVVEREDSP